MDAGGFESLKENNNKKNSEISIANAAYLKAKNYPYPQGNDLEKVWSELDLDDTAFSQSDFDDSSWDTFEVELQTSQDVSFPITFEQFFESGTTAENGVIWYRKSFDVDDTQENYTLRFNKGIDDIDYTYINGVLVGSILACCTDKKYEM